MAAVLKVDVDLCQTALDAEDDDFRGTAEDGETRVCNTLEDRAPEILCTCLAVPVE